MSTIKNPSLDSRPAKPDLPFSFQKTFDDSKNETISDLFGDFEQNFLEANLDKVISLEELKSIAEAIGKRDWGYVKYILTIICLILKSYQNISRHSDESLLSSGRRPLAFRPENRPSLPSGLKLIIPEKRKPFRKESDSSRETKAFKSDEINDQLMSLNKIFKQMKSGDAPKSLSNCWSCQNNICTIHLQKPQNLPSRLAEPGAPPRISRADLPDPLGIPSKTDLRQA